MSKIKLMLLDDHDVVRAGFMFFLSKLDDVEVLGSFGRVADLIAAMRAQAPDVVLLDYALGKDEVDGLLLVQSLCARFPSCRVLIVSALDVPAAKPVLQRAGAQGFINKSASTMDITKAIRLVAYGYQSWPDDLPGEGADDAAPMPGGFGMDALLAKLSPREREVIRCYLDGMSVSEIAQKFARSVKTISTQKQAAFEKLGIKSDRELFMLKNDV
ncbi:response regulator transcription factor [Chromobacterium sp. ASV23]|uniref:response regulator transcription factor n=1 Tax=Chromobacterium sp. ASV23 TaxID=2795110 RepID=UPI0018EB402F|nr:response regulator transcription factor [Chromobacterium sp. ASV23]